jgi:hypothetical protein
MSTLCSELSLWLSCGPSGLMCGVCLVSCGLVTTILLFVGCKQFLGIVETGTCFLY